MKKNYKMLYAIICSILVLSLCGCSKFSSKKEETDTEKQEETQEIDTNFVANTNISYSAGSDSDWSYGNQRKEFPQNEACYARISSTVGAEKKKRNRLEAKKEKESIVIFQYMPNSNAASVVLEVSYDEHVPAKYDVRNTIYFSNDTGKKEETETSK